MPLNKKGLAFQGSGSGRSNFKSLKASGADAQRYGNQRGRAGKGYRKKKYLNGNFIKKGASASGPEIDVAASLQREREQDELDRKCGFWTFSDGADKLGWLVNFNTCSIQDKESGQICSAVACYFLCQDGKMFKCKLRYHPYFYLQVKDGRELEVEGYLRRKFEGLLKSASIVYREDLDLKNHLAGHQRKLLKVSFDHTASLMEVRQELMPAIHKNRENSKRSDAYTFLSSLSNANPQSTNAVRTYDPPLSSCRPEV